MNPLKIILITSISFSLFSCTTHPVSLSKISSRNISGDSKIIVAENSNIQFSKTFNDSVKIKGKSIDWNKDSILSQFNNFQNSEVQELQKILSSDSSISKCINFQKRESLLAGSQEVHFPSIKENCIDSSIDFVMLPNFMELSTIYIEKSFSVNQGGGLRTPPAIYSRKIEPYSIFAFGMYDTKAQEIISISGVELNNTDTKLAKGAFREGSYQQLPIQRKLYKELRNKERKFWQNGFTIGPLLGFEKDFSTKNDSTEYGNLQSFLGLEIGYIGYPFSSAINYKKRSTSTKISTASYSDFYDYSSFSSSFILGIHLGGDYAKGWRFETGYTLKSWKDFANQENSITSGTSQYADDYIFQFSRFSNNKNLGILWRLGISYGANLVNKKYSGLGFLFEIQPIYFRIN